MTLGLDWLEQASRGRFTAGADVVVSGESSVGRDVKKAIQEVGVSYTIKRSTGDLIGEYLIYDTPGSSAGMGSKSSFAKESILEGSLAFDTVVVEGDVLELSNGKRVLVASKIADMFQDSVVIYETEFLKCNVVAGEVLRSSGEIWDDQTYHKQQVWESIKTGINGVLVEVSGTSLKDQNEFGLLSVTRIEAYVASGEDIRVLDRFQARSGEYYQVDVIKKTLYPAINVIEMRQDTR